MRQYVVVELRGRLGNQLFQFASGRGISRAMGAQLLFDRRLVSDSDLTLPRLVGDLYRQATDQDLRKVGSLAYRMDPAAIVRLTERRIRRIARATRGRVPAMVRLGNDTGEFHPELFSIDLPAFISGYLQDERYFQAIEPELISAFRWPTGIGELAPSPRPRVGISFRRGDFNSLGWALPLDFYDRALKLVLERVDDPLVTLFGDDTAFVEMYADRVTRAGHRVENAVARSSDPLSQLHMLAECEHAIIPNSTFSWWGAWLGDHAHDGPRVVVAASGYGAMSDQSLRESWHRLSPLATAKEFVETPTTQSRAVHDLQADE